MSLWATKSISVLRAQADAVGERSLRRHLGALNLITLGIGAIIGAGIFVLTGQAAAQYAGPAVWISMILVGIACAFAGLCYAEFASMIPIAGTGEPWVGPCRRFVTPLNGVRHEFVGYQIHRDPARRG